VWDTGMVKELHKMWKGMGLERGTLFVALR
jgi:hypothetical protein